MSHAVDALRHETFLRVRGDVDDRDRRPELPQLLEVDGRRVLDWCAGCDRYGPVTADRGLCGACAGLLLLPAAR